MKNVILTAMLSTATFMSCEKGDNGNYIPGQELQLSDTDQQQIKRTNAFTANFFLEVTKDSHNGNNAFLSPFGISTAMAMVYNGAGGETKEAISKVFRFDQIGDAQLNTYYQTLIKGLPLVESQTELHIGNAIWHSQNVPVNPDFLKINEQFYDARVGKLDFSDPNAKDVVNNWVKEKTRSKIDKILESTSARDLAYLINAIYFKGMWEQKFDKKDTKKAAFHLPTGGTVQADFMHRRHSYGMLTMGPAGVLAIEIPYTNKRFSMLLIQPTDALGGNWSAVKLAEFIGALGSESAKFQPTLMNLYLPKFKFYYEQDLNDVLTQMGMGMAFQDDADFSNLSDKPAKISEVKHKAFIEVDEEGTEAAAVTSVGVEVTSTPPEVRFDRPFIFVIKENKSNLVLFIGKINNPVSGETAGR